MAAAVPHPELAATVLEESGYTAMLQAEKTVEAAGRLEDLRQIPRLMEEYENLERFLEHISLVMDADTIAREGAVTIMSAP